MIVIAPAVLDVRTAHGFRLEVLDALERHDAVTIDLTAVRVLEPAGAAALVGAFRRGAWTGRTVRTMGLSGAAAVALTGLGLTGWFGAGLKGAA